jgi:chromosome segregation ATPase
MTFRFLFLSLLFPHAVGVDDIETYLTGIKDTASSVTKGLDSTVEIFQNIQKHIMEYKRSKEEEISKLKNSLASLKDSSEKAGQNEKSCEDKTSSIEQERDFFKGQLTQCENSEKSQQLTEKIESLEKERDQLQKNLQIIQLTGCQDEAEKIKELSATIESLQQEISSLKNQASLSQQSAKTLQVDLEKAQNDLKKSQQEGCIPENDFLEKYRDLITEYHAKQEELTHIQEKIASGHQTDSSSCTQISQENDQLKKDLSEARDHSNSLDRQVTELTEKMTHRDQDCISQEGFQKLYKDESAKLEAIKKESSELQEEINKKKKEAESIQNCQSHIQENKELEGIVKNLKEEKEKITHDHEVAQDKMKKISDELDEKNQELVDKDAQIKELEKTLQEERDTYQKDVASTQKNSLPDELNKAENTGEQNERQKWVQAVAQAFQVDASVVQQLADEGSLTEMLTTLGSSNDQSSAEGQEVTAS